jgi:hypothetical protein
MMPKRAKRFSDDIMLKKKHDAETCEAVFGQRHAQDKAMTPKGVKRFSDNVMLKTKQ